MVAFSKNINTKYVDNITGEYQNVNFCMFNAQCYLNGITYSCERINKHGSNGLYFKRDDVDSYSECGFNIEAEDPRIFILKDDVYVIFICLSPYQNQKRCIGITKFDTWEPIFLQIENMEKNDIEKNWAPFVKDNKLYFVYNYDPLIVINYDFNKEGLCKIVFKQDDCNLPFNTSQTFLRGGSNLIHYKDEYYIGGCHSRIYKDCFEHYTHIILLNTNTWKLVYTSESIVYKYYLNIELNSFWLSPGSKKTLDTINGSLVDRSPHIIQDPVSLYLKENKYYITINVRDCVSLLYEIEFNNLIDYIEPDKPVGYYDNQIREIIS
jgi:hypothetical protein